MGVYYDADEDEQNRKHFYSGIDSDYDELNELITNTHLHHLSYDTARREWLYPQVDRYPDWNLRGIYTNKTFVLPTDYNCEHSVPQSWFNEGLNFQMKC